MTTLPAAPECRILWASEQIADPKALARAKPGDVIPMWRSVWPADSGGVTLTDGGGI